MLKKSTKKSDEGITVKKEENFSEWFIQLVLKSKLADYSSVSGLMIYRPYSYEMWEKIKTEINKKFRELGVKNSYFPLLIPENLLSKEKEHVKGFAPEVAWVTYGGNTKLNERLAIRPTSEAIMYDSYSKWIRSWRDLPLLLNQWNNVIRWEFNNPVLFFRGREFLWNELHTVFATEEEALEHGEKIIQTYNKITEDLMALPGISGMKTEKEKFAGAIFTKKTHHYLPNGKIVEGACFHYDGQNFAKAYDIKFKDKKEKEEYAYQNTHAITTRMLGAMFAIHSDNKGLVLPPKIAPNKIVIVPIRFERDKGVIKKSKEIKEKLVGYNPILDDRLEVTPGYKFNEWELKGIPLRIEIGPRDIEKKELVLVRRDTFEKTSVKLKSLKKEISKELDKIQNNLYKKAKRLLEENIKKVDDKKQVIKGINDKKMVIAPMCKKQECEDILKTDTKGAKVLFIDPENRSAKNKRCVICDKPADYFVYIGKTY